MDTALGREPRVWWAQRALGLCSVCTGQRGLARSARPPGRSWVPEPESRGGGANTGSQEGAGLIRVSAERATQRWLRGDLNRSGQEWAGQPVGRPLLTWAEVWVLQPEGWWREVSRPGACLGGGRSWTWGEERAVTGTVVTVTVGDKLEGSALGKVLWP